MDVVEIRCPNCGWSVVVKNQIGVLHAFTTCPKCNCKYSVEKENIVTPLPFLKENREINVTQIISYDSMYKQERSQYDIFISYSREDFHIVESIIDKLEKDGFVIWIDRNGIMSGDAFKGIIVEAIEMSKVVLFFSSVSSNKSKWCPKEIEIANARGKKIIPIKLDNSYYNKEVELDLINLNYIDFTNINQREIRIEALVRDLNIMIDGLKSNGINRVTNYSIIDDNSQIMTKTKFKLSNYWNKMRKAIFKKKYEK